MNAMTYDSLFSKTLSKNRAMTFSHLIQAVVILVLLMMLLGKDRIVVMVPPTLDKQADIAKNASSQQLQVSWGLYVAGLFGNVTPKTAGFIKEAIAPMLAPSMYRDVMDTLDAQIKAINEDQFTISFAPTMAKWDQSVQRVVVTGQIKTRGVGGEETSGVRTYEVGFVTQNYRVLINDLAVYDGPPKTRAERVREERGG